MAGFWGANDQLKDPYHYGILLQNFQSIIAFPIWLFNANNWGNINLHKMVNITPGVLPQVDLPPEFYTEAAVVTPYEKIKFDSNMFLLFLVLQGLPIIFVGLVLLWVWVRVGVSVGGVPKLTSFGLYDTMFKLEVEGLKGGADERLKAESSDVLGIVEGATVHMFVPKEELGNRVSDSLVSDLTGGKGGEIEGQKTEHIHPQTADTLEESV